MTSSLLITRIVRGLVGVAAGYILLQVIVLQVANQNALSNPSRALAFVSNYPVAMVARARDGLDGASDMTFDMRIDLARGALERDPLTPFGFSVLAYLFEVSQRHELARRAIDAAADLSLRDRLAQNFKLREALSARDINVLYDRLDVAMRVGGGLRDRDVIDLVPMLEDASARQILSRGLAHNPPWRLAFLTMLSKSNLSLNAWNELRREIEVAGSSYSQSEFKLYLDRLIAGGHWMQAYVAWLRWLPEERRPSDAALYNADFRFGISGMPFDWTFEKLPGSDVSLTPLPTGTVLSVNFLGPRLAFKHVYQTLALPAGRYRFSGEEAARALQHELGLRWRLSCLGKAGQDVMTTDGLRGDVFWRGFSKDFEIAPECLFQRISLEMPIRVALDRVISGSVSFRNLKLEALP